MMESHEPFWAPSISNSPAQGNPTSHFRDFAYVPKSSGGTGSGGGSLAAISGVGSGSGSGGTSVYNNTARFPSKLHAMLSDLEIQGLSHIVSWQPHGRCFLVHRPDDFVKDVLSR